MREGFRVHAERVADRARQGPCRGDASSRLFVESSQGRRMTFSQAEKYVALAEYAMRLNLVDKPGGR